MDHKNYSEIILLLGNGFDLSFYLPTDYLSFLQTIKFLKDNKEKNFSTIGEIFRNKSLQNGSKTIENSYIKHQTAYDKCQVDNNEMKKIIELSDDNCWVNFFLHVLNKNVGWIDFEKEIKKVVYALSSFFKSGQIKCSIHDKTTLTDAVNYVYLSKFDKVFFKSENLNGMSVGLKSDYTEPIDKKVFQKSINTEKIIDYFYNDLVKFSELLKSYFICFVERPAAIMVKNGNLKLKPYLYDATKAITFNYTSIYEMLSPNTNIIHIHGDLKKSIILGINPGEEDKLEQIDTSFIKFKKYSQRAFYETESEYIDLVKTRTEEIKIYKREAEFKRQYYFDPTPTLLCVYGHSLDITDKDIIENLFEIATDIEIYYHSDQAKVNYIKNVVQMFGREKYDILRREKNLTFSPII